MLKIKGKIKTIGELITFDSGFKKKEFVIETEDKYPQLIKFELVKDNTCLVDFLEENAPVEVFFNIRGNEYKEKIYNSLQAWKVDIC